MGQKGLNSWRPITEVNVNMSRSPNVNTFRTVGTRNNSAISSKMNSSCDCVVHCMFALHLVRKKKLHTHIFHGINKAVFCYSGTIFLRSPTHVESALRTDALNCILVIIFETSFRRMTERTKRRSDWLVERRFNDVWQTGALSFVSTGHWTTSLLI